MSDTADRPLIAHVIFSLGVGGLENGVINLINRMPEKHFRHVIICIKNSTDFSQRLQRNDVVVYELHKKEGQDWHSFVKMYRLLRELKPAIVHTRNLACIEYQVPALLAGVPYRIHGEHGWDVFDPEGNNKKYQLLRRLLGLIIHRFIPLSEHLQAYLCDKVGIADSKITRICNGVDTSKFYPGASKQSLPDCPFEFDQKTTNIGTVGRMHGVKDQLTLVKAFIRMLELTPELRNSVKLILIGDGPIKKQAQDLLKHQQLQDLVWMPGARNDIADIMRNLDIFVLPSKAEGISNTILEAMATGLPVVATNVGGNPELIVDKMTGRLVPKEDELAMAEALIGYVKNPDMIKQHGQKGLERIQELFALDVMVGKYLDVYNSFNLNQ
jgi:sugar transferase (PEP-CTERM/EpsH1 system associated)